MTLGENACSSFHFSTAGMPHAARAQVVRALYERIPVPGRIEPLEPLSGRPVHVDIYKVALPGLGMISGTLAGVRQLARPRAAVSADQDDLMLAVNLRGRSSAQQGSCEVALNAGDAMLATRGLSGFTITRPQSVRFIGFRVPRSAIAPLVGRLDDAPIRTVPRGSAALDLLITYAGAITVRQPPEAPDLQRLVVNHIHDLIAATVGASRDGWAIAERRGIRAARLQSIFNDIAAHLDDFELSAAAVANRQGITPRYVHKLFAEEGLTFSEYVLGRRLARVHRMLGDPRLGGTAISRLAFDAGFGDLSYFNRAFRRRYLATPSDVRAFFNRQSP